MTHVFVQGTNRPPPRRSPAVTLPLADLWTLGIDPNTRQDVLRILSRIAANQVEISPTTELVADRKEASHE